MIKIYIEIPNQLHCHEQHIPEHTSSKNICFIHLPWEIMPAYTTTTEKYFLVGKHFLAGSSQKKMHHTCLLHPA